MSTVDMSSVFSEIPSADTIQSNHRHEPSTHLHRFTVTRKPHLPALCRSQTHALINADQFNALYEQSLRNPDAFWLEQANSLEWFKKPTIARKFTWDTAARKIEHTFFEDGQLNLTVNCLDRHVKTALRDKLAIIWQGDAEDEVKKITYGEFTPRSANAPMS